MARERGGHRTRAPGVAPRFSVVIPTYNRSKAVQHALRSVFDQDCADFEVIVVDDGSTDDTLERLKGINDPRLIVVRQANGGAALARNRGIMLASGQFIAFLDSDDRFLPEHLSRASAELARRSEDNLVLFSPVIVDRGEGIQFIKPPRAMRPHEEISDYLMRDRGFIQTSGIIAPAGLCKAVCFSTGLRFGQDTDFCIRLDNAGARFHMFETPSVIWKDVVDDQRISSSRKGHLVIDWLESVRPIVSKKAYLGYRGWHVAKGLAPIKPWKSAQYYVSAVYHRCYSTRLSLIVLLQIILPNKLYHRLANEYLGTISGKKISLSTVQTVDESRQ